MIENITLSPEVTLAGAAAILGGMLLKIVEKLQLSKSVVDEYSTLRKELRDELDTVKAELGKIREEVDEWREKYYSQVETTTELLYEVSALKTRLRKYESDSGEYTSTE